MSEQLYIPPKDMPVRLVGFHSQCALYQLGEDEVDVGHAPAFEQSASADHDVMFWYIVPATGKYQGYYLIKSKWSGRVLFSRTHKSPPVGSIAGDGQYDDNYFKLEPGRGEYDGYFRLRNYHSDTVLYSRRVPKREQIGNVPASQHSRTGDQYFRFLYRDMEVVNIEFHRERGKVIDVGDEILGSKTQSNNSDLEQTLAIKFTRTEKTQHSFVFKAGLGLKMGAKFSSGVPSIVDGQVSTEFSASLEFTFGTTLEDTRQTEVSAPVRTPARHRAVVKTVARRSKMEVPYTMTLKAKGFNATATSTGVFTSACVWDIHDTISTEPL
ncbi:Natterin-4 [Cytospora mali]|uniref:Natterin-4 n=1 Tax=Cytospora mali TaxID=578113 RepID=A0A194UXB0_CYTMA|nr:Natterin-4 [Valsa mali var. pyri (nom. inval.)]